MGNRKTPVTEWDAEEQAESRPNCTYPQFLAHLVLTFWPLVTLAVTMAGTIIWFDHYP